MKIDIDAVRFDEPDEVIAQIEALGWMLGQVHTNGTITENYSFGLYCIFNMIGDNAKSMIAKLENNAIETRKRAEAMEHNKGRKEK